MRNIPLAFVSEDTLRSINATRCGRNSFASDVSGSLFQKVRGLLLEAVAHVFDVRNFDGPYWLAHLERELSQPSRLKTPRR